jgi:hypothetical protein
MGKSTAFKRLTAKASKIKIPKIKTLAALGIGTAVVANNIRNPDGDRRDECGLTDIDCIFSKIKTFLMWAAIALVVAFSLWRVFGDALGSFISEEGKNMLQGKSPTKPDRVILALPTVGPPPRAGGGKNNNLDKYMYCLILLLGIGIHHLYENYENKINQYLELIVK